MIVPWSLDRLSHKIHFFSMALSQDGVFFVIVIGLAMIVFLLVKGWLSTKKPNSIENKSKSKELEITSTYLHPRCILVAVELSEMKDTSLYYLSHGMLTPTTSINVLRNGKPALAKVLSSKVYEPNELLPCDYNQLKFIELIIPAKRSTFDLKDLPSIEYDFPDATFDFEEETFDFQTEKNLDQDSSFEVTHDDRDDRDF